MKSWHRAEKRERISCVESLESRLLLTDPTAAIHGVVYENLFSGGVVTGMGRGRDDRAMAGIARSVGGKCNRADRSRGTLTGSRTARKGKLQWSLSAGCFTGRWQLPRA